MRAMRAEEFSGYKGLSWWTFRSQQARTERYYCGSPPPGVTPLDHTILSGQYTRAKAPLVLGGEGAAVIEEGGESDFPVGSRVMFAGPYGVSEDGAYSEWLAVRKEHICPIPEAIDDVTAAGIPVAYLTAHISLTLAGFQPGKTVLAPAIGGSVGNAVTQLARPWVRNTLSRAPPTITRLGRQRRSDSTRSLTSPARSWAMGCDVSQAVVAQTS